MTRAWGLFVWVSKGKRIEKQLQVTATIDPAVEDFIRFVELRESLNESFIHQPSNQHQLNALTNVVILVDYQPFNL